MKKRVFVDMDNVLVDFQSGLDQQSEQTLQQYAGRLDEIPGLFGKMKPLVGAIDAVHQLNEYYDLFILSTAPWNNPSAWSDKVKWVTEYLDDFTSGWLSRTGKTCVKVSTSSTTVERMGPVSFRENG